MDSIKKKSISPPLEEQQAVKDNRESTVGKAAAIEAGLKNLMKAALVAYFILMKSALIAYFMRIW